jgi:hypothetical protein
MLYETRFLISLLVTLIIEVPILLFILKFLYKNRKSLQKIISVGLVASTLTLPYLWFVFPPYILSNYYIYVGEFLVILFESLIYMQFLELKFSKAFLISLICNVVSFLIGVIIF